MHRKIIKSGNWESWKRSKTKHDFEILIINVAVILSVFVFAAIIQP
ncbi:hypothetical protein NG800_008390 [Epilithonimonas ginsengisoli]|uniref:Uncharacterized protein n=1 Tax=Epilithonimonas ginsengisoli TaxID=1245592 RepID=A0ABU4JH24_9FLAO|nr:MULTISPECIES: hypothetical protein [Chryseobacterium group]MBV6878742.1 hypothetical protein [Epilithonimonas sp. FP105]MDW8548927.1 hypothetical protein [Epilithonimonas ginsengisoli]